MYSSTTEKVIVSLIVALFLFVGGAIIRDYWNGKDVLLVAQVTHKQHERIFVEEATYDEDGNVSWDTVERNYYWLFYTREDGQAVKYDVGSPWALNKYAIGQKLIVRLRIGASGAEYFRRIDIYQGAEVQ